jgi:hypothetical protein
MFPARGILRTGLPEDMGPGKDIETGSHMYSAISRTNVIATGNVRPTPRVRFASVSSSSDNRTITTRKSPPAHSQPIFQGNLADPTLPLRPKATLNSISLQNRPMSTLPEYGSASTPIISSEYIPDVAVVSPSTPYDAPALDVLALHIEAQSGIKPVSTWRQSSAFGKADLGMPEYIQYRETATPHSTLGPSFPPACYIPPRVTSGSLVLWDAIPNSSLGAKAVSLPKLSHETCERSEPHFDDMDSPYSEVFDFAMYLNRMTGESRQLSEARQLKRHGKDFSASSPHTPHVDGVVNSPSPSDSTSSALASSQEMAEIFTLLDAADDETDARSMPFGRK